LAIIVAPKDDSDAPSYILPAPRRPPRLAELADTVGGKQLATSPTFAEDLGEVQRRYKAVEEVWACAMPVGTRRGEGGLGGLGEALQRTSMISFEE
jgi:hypothetical protein